MEIKVIPAKPEQLKKKPADESKLGFGDILTDHIFLMDYEKGKGWMNPRIEPYRPLSLDPAAMVLHYGQEVFEGLKAYRGKDGTLYLFRARDNFVRMNRSAVRVCMPEVDPDFGVEALKKLIVLDKDWVPKTRGTSLYIRPTMIAVEPHLGVRPAHTYLFYIIIGPVGAYYKEGLNPVKIYVEDKYIRAALGGAGGSQDRRQLCSKPACRGRGQGKGFHPGPVARRQGKKVCRRSGDHEHVLRDRG